MGPKKTQFRYCKIPSCDTYTVRGLYAIPEHPIKRQSWIEACNLPQDVSSSAKICWKHFQSNDFKSEIDFENIKTCRFPTLKSGAVPSLLLNSSEIEGENVSVRASICCLQSGYVRAFYFFSDLCLSTPNKIVSATCFCVLSEEIECHDKSPRK